MGATARSLIDFQPREWKIMVPLMFAGFFEVYDTTVLSIGGPAIAAGLGVSVATFGFGVALIRLAALGSIPVLRVADRIGRRQMLIWSIVVFTLATGSTALAWSLLAFVVIQTVARIFLATEGSLASLVISEEIRRDRRGAGQALLGLVSAFGPAFASLLLLAVPHTPLGWRLFYVAAIAPLIIVAYLRRNLAETEAFTVARDDGRIEPGLLPRLPAAYRNRLVRITAVLSAGGAVQTAAFLYASELAQDVYGWRGLFTLVVLTSAPFALAGFIGGGPVSDRFGRRPTLAVALLAGITAVWLTFSEIPILFPAGWWLAVGASSALFSVSLAYLAELFPTELRGTLTSTALSINIAAGSLGLLIVGALADVVDTSTQLIVFALAVLPVLLLIRGLPETRGADIVHAVPAAAR
ncbi:MAG: MFS transporter [Solirubrobacterales bacterium]